MTAQEEGAYRGMAKEVTPLLYDCADQAVDY